MSSMVIPNPLYKRENKTSRQKMNRVFLVIVLVLFVILLLELIFHLVISPRMKLSKIEIVSDESFPLSDAAILDVAGIADGVYYFSIDELAVRQRLENYPLIKSAEVQKIFPNGLRLRFEQRTPLAMSLIEINGRSVPVCLDDEGVVFQIGPSVEIFDLPVLSGLHFREVKLGHRVNENLVDFLRDLKSIRSSTLTLFNLVSEVKFVNKSGSGFEALLYIRDYPVKVRIGNTISEDLIKRVLLVLDVFRSQGLLGNLEEIDFRSEKVVSRMKEG